MKIKDSAGYTICRVARKVHQQITEKFSAYDMPLGQWVTLKTLAENDGISQKQLADLLEKDQNNVKAMIDRLEKKKLLCRAVNPADKRAFSLFVTEKGNQWIEQLSVIDEQAIAEIEAPLTQAEIQQFSELLGRIEKVLDEKKASADM